MSHYVSLVIAVLLFCTVAHSSTACLSGARQNLFSNFDVLDGLFQTTGWWNSANVYTALVNDALLGHDNGTVAQTINVTALLDMLLETHALYSLTNFTDDYNDDDGWWGLMFTRAHDLALVNGQPDAAALYLNTAEFLWHDMAKSWNATAAACGGGIWWSKTIHYKNAIANELFFALAAELGVRVSQATDRVYFETWAWKELQWFNQSGMINSVGTINDGLTPQCTNNGETTWTYNQGVILGGLAALYRLHLLNTGEAQRSLLDQGVSIFQSAITALTSDGVLHEPCEPNCGADGCQFKGIFVRNVMYLSAALSSAGGYTTAVASMKTFIATNANFICAHDEGSNGALGVDWAGPFDSSSASACTTSSALDCLVAQRAFDA